MTWLARSLRLPLLLALALGMAACRTAPLYAPTDVSLYAPTGATLSQVATSIMQAGASLHWLMTDRGPGVIRGMLDRHSNRCEVEIRFDTARFSIQYLSSENLRYDAADGTIHKGYNKWIKSLEHRIRQRASLIPK